MTAAQSEKRRGPIVVAGNLSLDDTVTPLATTRDAPGGDALYAAMGVRAWGFRPVLLTLVGSDYPVGHLERISAAGIETSHVRAVPGPTVHYLITYLADGSRRFEWLSDPDRLAATSPTEEDYAVLADPAWLHIAAMPIEHQEIAVDAARRAGVPYSLDPHEEYVSGFERRIRAMVDGGLFMPSELELRLLFPDLGASDAWTLAERAAQRLEDWGVSGSAIKLGAEGSLVRTSRVTTHVRAAATDVVDPTGAGDAYCGGFVAGWLATGSPLVAAACGTVAAAESIAAFGAFGSGTEPTTAERIDRALVLIGEASEVDAAAIRAAFGASPLSLRQSPR
jgi:ribokinase